MENAAARIESSRDGLALAQEALAAALGISSAAVNFRENNGRKSSALAWKKPAELESASDKSSVTDKKSLADQNSGPLDPEMRTAPQIDFSGNPQAVKAVAEAQRLAFARTINPAFATEISRIDPLPHQRIAVYERMRERGRDTVMDNTRLSKLNHKASRCRLRPKRGFAAGVSLCPSRPLSQPDGLSIFNW